MIGLGSDKNKPKSQIAKIVQTTKNIKMNFMCYDFLSVSLRESTAAVVKCSPTGNSFDHIFLFFRGMLKILILADGQIKLRLFEKDFLMYSEVILEFVRELTKRLCSDRDVRLLTSNTSGPPLSPLHWAFFLFSFLEPGTKQKMSVWKSRVSRSLKYQFKSQKIAFRKSPLPIFST